MKQPADQKSADRREEQGTEHLGDSCQVTGCDLLKAPDDVIRASRNADDAYQTSDQRLGR